MVPWPCLPRGQKKSNESDQGRIVKFGLHRDRGRFATKFVSNAVTSTKYTLLNFIPKNLWEQFHKISNFYFLFIAILQTIPPISTTDGVPTIAVPLVFVLVLNAAKDAFEDWRRHLSDRLENTTASLVVATEGSSQEKKREGVKGYFDPESPYYPVPLQSQSARAVVAAAAAAAGPDSHRLPNDLPTDVALTTAILRSSFCVVGDAYDQKQQEVVTPESWHSGLSPDIECALLSGLVDISQWQYLEVGDLVLCRDREAIPADLVLLAASDPNGAVFVETSSLDGETNLKVKEVPSALVAWAAGLPLAKIIAEYATCKGELECPAPDANLYRFEGVLSIENGGKSKRHIKETISLTPSNLLLRGCRLKNTSWALGVVAFTGSQTKIQMNSAKGSRKISHVERYTNKLTLIVFAGQMALCLAGAIGTAVVVSKPKFQARTYLDLRIKSAAKEGIKKFFTWVVLMVNMIPISLIVTMGMVKAAQALLFNIDRDMYHSPTKTFAVARSSDLNEELGQVECLFSDKTGTLTCNCMQFKACCINGHKFGKVVGAGTKSEKGLSGVRKNTGRDGAPFEVEPNVSIEDSRLTQLMTPDGTEHSELFVEAVDFFLHLAINQAVVAELHGNGGGNVTYSASSPDEGAFVSAAKHFNVIFSSRACDKLTLNVLGVDVFIKILAVIEFDSVRKRSSVLCQFPETLDDKLPLSLKQLLQNRTVLYCKGADVIIFDRLKGHLPAPESMVEAVEAYAVAGLRTLCIAKREVSTEEAQSWMKQYDAACLDLGDREAKINSAAELLETELELQGITAVEDCLQAGVPESIESFLRAGIDVWMLTGDKVETAINIGVATNLLTTSTRRLIYQRDKAHDSGIVGSSSENLERWKILNRLEQDLEYASVFKKPKRLTTERIDFATICQHVVQFIQKLFIATQLPTWREPNKNSSDSVAIIIDGECLGDIIRYELEEPFMRLCSCCTAVICCRVTPQQKGLVVLMAKRLLGVVTLAVGDGANDCNMIQSADVGIGIRGLEGLQAFNASDYGISQFRFLRVLILCHGRWCYRRLAKLVMYMFYKNLLVVLPIFFFAFHSLWSGQKIYYDYIYQLYNVLLTSVPVIVFGIFDQDVNKQLSLAFPELYRLGQRNHYLNAPIFIRYMINGIAVSLIIFYLPFIAFEGNKLNHSGLSTAFWIPGHLTLLLVVIVNSVKILSESATITWFLWLSVVISVLAWVLCIVTFGSWPSRAPDILGLASLMFSNRMFYIVLLAAPVICFSWDFFWRVFRRNFLPELYHVILKEAQRYPVIDRFPLVRIQSMLFGMHLANYEDFQRRKTKRRLGEDDFVLRLSAGPRKMEEALDHRSSTYGRGFAFAEADREAREMLARLRSQGSSLTLGTSFH